MNLLEDGDEPLVVNLLVRGSQYFAGADFPEGVGEPSGLMRMMARSKTRLLNLLGKAESQPRNLMIASTLLRTWSLWQIRFT